MEFCWQAGSLFEPTDDVQNVTRIQLSVIVDESELPLIAT